MDKKEWLEDLVRIQRKTKAFFKKNNIEYTFPSEQDLNHSTTERYGVVGDLNKYNVNDLIEEKTQELKGVLKYLFFEIEVRGRETQEQKRKREIVQRIADKKITQLQKTVESMEYDRLGHEATKKDLERKAKKSRQQINASRKKKDS
ncbi:hypothetical protein GOV14_02270 [Candidatus Pacearchaeota archaeon]|nr:hypothetical protein [Candidatus Pacearchaeota archaeon]